MSDNNPNGEAVYAHEDDLNHLKAQHDLICSSTRGVLVTTPLRKGSKIRVLDCGCADGYWLRDLLKRYPQYDWSLHGVDVTGDSFPTNGPDSLTTLEVHDIHSLPPRTWQWENSFDLVHQRLAVTWLRTAHWPTVLRNHFELLKPGGWIQLVECSWLDENDPWNEKRAAPVWRKIARMERYITEDGFDIFVCYKLEDKLRDAGFVNINTTEFKVGYGPQAVEESWQQRSIDLFVDFWRRIGSSMPAAGWEGVAGTPDEYAEMLKDLRTELELNGYAPTARFVAGQKPLA